MNIVKKIIRLVGRLLSPIPTRVAAATGGALALVGLVAILRVSMPGEAQAQPAPGYYTPIVYASGGIWTNRIAGSTSTTNVIAIDISALRNVTVELEGQNITGGASNLTLYLGKGNASVGANTNAIDWCATVTTIFSGTALTTTYGHTNFSPSSSANQCLAGYRYLYLGPITNLFAAGGSYATNIKVYVTGN